MQVKPGKSHGPITRGGGAATQHRATSQLHDDIVTRSFSRCYHVNHLLLKGTTSTLPFLPGAAAVSVALILPAQRLFLLGRFARRAMGRHLEPEPGCWCAKIQCVQYLRLSWNDSGGKSWEVPREGGLIMLLDLTAGQGHKFGQLTPSTFMHAALSPPSSQSLQALHVEGTDRRQRPFYVFSRNDDIMPKVIR
ncbi:hypothetical protein KVR01_010522 [Diaporthe batatas]|uniref:uncharacterized protein n=1 Tax=Diaporthe batatas TaxID=748121 RepID=UPI001D03CF81|nr:uncharacterized protein KVR01_010522 [Diaporthe batatas]KAG8159885.1 hypothetical protein KVR01_010522 [Diaporthe batatas]